MASDSLQPVPLLVTSDVTLGARWTSLRSQAEHGSREWLWKNPDQRLVWERMMVGPQSPFVDAGGGEECFPCVREPWDHGLVWNRPWSRSGDIDTVEAEGYQLRRRMAHVDGEVVVDYEASAVTASEALHATHLLLDLSHDARLVPGEHVDPVFVDERPDDEIASMGSIERFVETLGTGRRSAVCYVLPSCRRLRIYDRSDVLEMELDGAAELPLSFIVWRNLSGWPSGDPYRSIGIEPSLGAGVSIPSTRPDGSVLLRAKPTTWQLRLRAFSSC